MACAVIVVVDYCHWKGKINVFPSFSSVILFLPMCGMILLCVLLNCVKFELHEQNIERRSYYCEFNIYAGKMNFVNSAWQMWITHYVLHYQRKHYLLPAWNRVHLENLTDSELVKKLPAFDGTHRYNTTFKSAHHLTLSWL